MLHQAFFFVISRFHTSVFGPKSEADTEGPREGRDQGRQDR